MAKIRETPLARAFFAARRHLGLSQAEIGAQIGVSVRTISRWEMGHWVPGRSCHAALLEAFSELPPPMLRELTREVVGVDPGEPAQAPAAASPPANARATMEQVVYRAAEELDVGPRRLRAALLGALEAMEREGLSVGAARQALGASASAPTKPSKA